MFICRETDKIDSRSYLLRADVWLMSREREREREREMGMLGTKSAAAAAVAATAE